MCLRAWVRGERGQMRVVQVPSLEALSLPTLFAQQVALEERIEVQPSAPQGLPSRLAVPFPTQETTIPCHFTPELVYTVMLAASRSRR
jgi:hypothetical protein